MFSSASLFSSEEPEGLCLTVLPRRARGFVLNSSPPKRPELLFRTPVQFSFSYPRGERKRVNNARGGGVRRRAKVEATDKERKRERGRKGGGGFDC